MKATQTLNQVLLLHRPRPSLQTNKNCAIATFLLCSNVESTTKLSTGMTKNTPCLWLCSRLIGLLSRPLKLCSDSCRSFKTTSQWLPLFDTCTYAWHYVYEPFEIVAECNYCAIKDNRDYYKKDDRLKNSSSTVEL